MNIFGKSLITSCSLGEQTAIDLQQYQPPFSCEICIVVAHHIEAEIK